MKKIAVILSGCGFLDGTEITEAISTLIHISQMGANYDCFSLDKNFPAKDHVTKADSGQQNILHTSARLSRGDIKPLAKLNEIEFDALVFPGGYGAAMNLSNWGEKGSKCTIEVEVERVILAFHKASKPIGAICIAPTLIAKVLGKTGVCLTIGNDKETALEIEKTGAIHEICSVTDFVSDRENKVITTPAYMYEAKPHEVFVGIGKMIKELVEMA